jgi:hypothetical protein
VTGRWEGSIELFPAADELEEALTCERELLPDGLACGDSVGVAAAAAAVAVARCLSAASRSCKGHISVRPLDHEAAAEA